jgi:hypothetical protein
VVQAPDVSKEDNKSTESSLKQVSFESLKSAENFVFERKAVPTEQLSAENNNQAASGSLLRAMFPPSQP